MKERSSNTNAIENYFENATEDLEKLADKNKTPIFYKILFLLQECIIRQKEIDSNNFDSFITQIHTLANKTLHLSCSIYSKKLALATESFLPVCEPKISIIPLVKNHKKIIQNGIQDTIINKKYEQENIYFLQSKYLKNFLFVYEPKRADKNETNKRRVMNNNEGNIDYLCKYISDFKSKPNSKRDMPFLRRNINNIRDNLVYVNDNNLDEYNDLPPCDERSKFNNIIQALRIKH